MTNLAIFSPIKLGPVVASPPYTEGEFYSVEKRKVAVQVAQLYLPVLLNTMDIS